jgi:hypothetical protein
VAADEAPFHSPRCECGRFVKVWGCRHHGEGYAATWYAVGVCSRCGEVPIEWEWLGDFDPEEMASG